MPLILKKRFAICYVFSFFVLIFTLGCSDDSPTGNDTLLDENATIVINEINYNSSDDFNPGDWVEFYNTDESPVDLSGWTFMDEDNTHIYIVPDSTIIPSNGYLVLCTDTAAFNNLYPDVSNYLGNINFGFSGRGELLRLYNVQGELIDQVNYDDNEPWPVQPDGLGSTLALVHPARNNELPENWAASLGHGTPGAINDVYIPLN
ncbi:lamin tail domain-containing protein [Candidatus Latescibacterota bacterium]